MDPSGHIKKICSKKYAELKQKEAEGGKLSLKEKYQIYKYEKLNGVKASNNFGFTIDEINNLKNTVINEGQMLKDMGLSNKLLGPAIAGAYDRTTGKIYTAINDYTGNAPKELAPIIRERIKNMPSEVSDSYIKTKGPGTHAEVYVNRTLGTSKPVIEIPFETCPHCRYILKGFNIISNN